MTKFDINGQVELSTYENKVVIPISERKIFENLLNEQANKNYKYTCEIKRKVKDKSQNLNSYMWQLCTKVAKELSKEYPTSKDDVYRQAIRQGNLFYSTPVKHEAVEHYKKIWANREKRVGWFAEEAYKSPTLEGFTTMHCYWGSSEYDGKQLHDLVQIIVEEAKEFGIETKTPQELVLLEQQWQTAYEKKEEKEELKEIQNENSKPRPDA